MNWIKQWLADLPTTPLRIAVTILVIVGTAIRYVGWGVPSAGVGWEGWLTFLVVLSGIDAAQFTAKRLTTRVDVIEANAAARQLQQGSPEVHTETETETTKTTTRVAPPGDVTI